MNKLVKISRTIYIITLIGLPFIVSPYSFTPYTLPKLFFLCFGTLLSLILFIISKPKELKFPNKIFLIFILIELLNLFSFQSSMFPRYSEHPMICVILFINIFLALNLFENLNLEKIVIYSSFLVAIPSLVDIFTTSERVSGTLGQANFLSFFFVLTILCLIDIWNKVENKKLFFVYLLIITFLFIKTASIAALISLVSGVLLLKERINFINKKNLVILSSVLFIFIIFAGGIYISKIKDVYNQINNPKQTILSDSFLIRKVIWYQTLNIVSNNPEKILFGFGSNNFNFYFEKNRPEALNELSEKNLLFDKPHNYFIEILFNYGIVYLGIFLVLIYTNIKIKKNNFIIIPFLIFLLFNWLDIYLKVIFYLYLFINLETIKIKSDKFIIFKIFSIALAIFVFISSLFLNDTKSYLGDKNYIYSFNREKIISLEIKDPLILLVSLRFLEDSDKVKITEYLIKNFPNNQAVLFQLN